MNLVWICRDPDLIEYYLHKVPLDTQRAWSFIFYTGKRKLVLSSKLRLNERLKIFMGRPDLEDVICSIVDNVSTGTPISDALIEGSASLDRELWGQDDNAALRHMFEKLLQIYR